jgi:hypothetical protein
MSNNPNSPENLLKPWLKDIDHFAMECRVYDKHIPEFEAAILAHILEFADQHQKLFEMLHWLTTQEAELFFANASDYSEDVYREFQLINGLDSFSLDSDEEDFEFDPEYISEYLEDIRYWIREKRYDFPVVLELHGTE